MRRIILLLIIAAGCTFMCPAAVASAAGLSDIYDTVSDNDLQDATRPLIDYDDLIMLLNSYTGYTGTIPVQYIDYMRSCLNWSAYGDHYVAFVSSYVVNNNTRSYYVIAIGDISYNQSVFAGNGVDVYEFYPNIDSYNGYSNYRHTIQGSFSYRPTSLCFTDLTPDFPDLRLTTDKYLYVILAVMACCLCFYTFTKFGWHNLRRRKVLR